MKVFRPASWLFATTALAAACGAASASAQTAAATTAPAETTALGEVVVTARRVEERLQDVPISITVFSQEQLNNRNIVNPSELATYTPSLSVNRQFGSEKSSFAIRGFVQELGTQPSVAVYFADVVAPRAQGPTTSGSGAVPGTLFDLQNVQVLKGPQGTLFGRNTTGGAVLLVPQRPTDRQEGYVEATVGNYDARRLQGVVNTPLSDKARLRIGFDAMKRDGYLRNRSGIGPSDFADVNYVGARASLVLDLTPNLENYTILSFNQSDTHGQLPRLIGCARDPATRTPSQFLAAFGCAQLDRQAARGDGYYDVENDVPKPLIHLQQWQAINTTTWEVNDQLTIKNIISYAEFRERTRINLMGDRLLAGPLALRISAIQPGPTGENASQYTFTEELQFQGRTASERLVWQAGGYFELSKPIESNTQLNELFLNCANPQANQCVSPLGPFGSVSLLDQRYEFRNLAAYAQATYSLTDQLSLTGGIRYTSDRTEAVSQNVTTRFLPAPFVSCSKGGRPVGSIEGRAACTETFTQKSAKPTWLIDLDYKPTEDVLIYAKYARGYRQGVINLLPLSTALNTAGPEKVDTYEIGLKANFDGPISGGVNIAAFYNDFTDQQLQANTLVRNPSTFPANVVVNAGKSKIKGVELDAYLRPFDGFRLDVAYAYLDTELQSITFPDLSADPNYSGLVSTAQLGGPLAYSPKNRLTVTGAYTLPLPEEIGRVTVSATYTHTDKQFATHADDAFAFQLGYNPGLLPATDLLNLNLDWKDVGGRPVDLSVFATNVTNEKYHVAAAQIMQIGYESIIIGEPRMYGVRVRYRFGG